MSFGEKHVLFSPNPSVKKPARFTPCGLFVLGRRFITVAYGDGLFIVQGVTLRKFTMLTMSLKINTHAASRLIASAEYVAVLHNMCHILPPPTR